MSKNKIQKLISVMLMLALAAQWIPCGAANIVPINGGNVAVPPSAPVSKTNIDSKNPGGGFSLQAMKSKIDEIINPQKSKAALKDNPSGTCGDNCFWSLDTSTGKLTISGLGEMTGQPWDSYRSSIKSVIIGDGVTSIIAGAFFGCSFLTSVTIGNSVASIGYAAFQDCSALTSVTIPDSVTYIGGDAFRDCSALTSIDIPDSVTSIEEGTFRGCENLTEVNIGDAVISIGNAAFRWCPKLENVYLGKKVKNIDINAFTYCYPLKSFKINTNNENLQVKDGVLYSKDGKTIILCPTGKEGSYLIPSYVTSINHGAFSRCWSLSSIKVEDDNEYFSSLNGLLLNKNGSKLIQYPPGKSESNYVIPEQITDIGDGAFYECEHLINVTIGNQVTSIGEQAFSYCRGLVNVSIGKCVTYIGKNAFSWCEGKNFKSIYVDPSNKYYKSVDDVLFNKNGSTLIQYPTGKEGDYVIPDNVTIIDDDAFCWCEGLTSVKIPSSMIYINKSAFYRCKLLTEIIIPEQVISIGNFAFHECHGLTELNIPNSVTSIGWGSFGICSGLKNVTIGNGVTSIGDQAFSDCENLTVAKYFGNSDPGANSINVFFNCNKLKEVNVPATYTDCTFCDMPINGSEAPCSSSSFNSNMSSSKAHDDNKYIVEIKLDVGVKVNKKDVNEFIQIICEKSDISPDKVSVKVKTDDENNLLSILVYVNDEETANTIVAKINEEKQKC